MTSLKDFFFKNRTKNVPKSCSNKSDECLADQQHSHTCFQRVLKISGKKIKSNRNGGLKLQVHNLQNYSIPQTYCL